MCQEILVGNNHEEEQKITAMNVSGMYAWFGSAEWLAQSITILADKIYYVLHNTQWRNRRIGKICIGNFNKV
jgi:hypothetical protein